MIYLRSILFSLFTIYCYRSVVSIALRSTNLKKTLETESRNDSTVRLENTTSEHEPMNRTLVRSKRENDGASKFSQAAKMDQLKVLRLILQNFKNSWDSSFIGGAHPLHHHVPKTIVKLYKTKIVEFFFPAVGEEEKGK